MKLSKHQTAVLALILANVIWGAAPPIFKWALADIHPFTLAFLRFVLPAVIMFPFVRHKLKVHSKDVLSVAAIGFFGITVNILCFFLGLLQAPSINASLIASSAPIFLILYALFFLRREKPRKKLIFGSVIGLLGVLMVLIVPFFRHGNVTAIGNLLYLGAMFGGVIAIVLVRKVMKRNTPESITFWSFVFGAIGFIPFFMYEVGQYGFLPNISMQGILGLLYGVFFSSLTAYFLQTYALKYLAAADVGVFTYIDPVVTILVAAPLLMEFPDTTFVFGSVFVLLGILIAEGRLHYHPFHLFLKK